MSGHQNSHIIASDLSERDEAFFDDMINFAEELNINSRKVYGGATTVPHEENAQSVQVDLIKELFCDFLRDSTIASKQIIVLLMKNVEQLAWERQIESKKFVHTTTKTIQMAERLLAPNIYVQDGEYDPSDGLYQRLDNEPNLPLAENWLRCKVDVEGKSTHTEFRI
jgi:hypothetical protein